MKERSKAVRCIEKIDHGVTRVFDKFSLISTIALIVVMLMAVIDVVGGKLFHKPFAPAYELTQMFSIPLVFFTVGVVQMGRGMMRKVKEHCPNANIAAIDYDPGTTRVNQENRIKLMLAVAKERLNAPAAPARPLTAEEIAGGAPRVETTV